MNIQSSSHKSIIFLALLCIVILLSLFLVYFTHYIGSFGSKPEDEPLFIKIDTDEVINLQPITIDQNTVTFRQITTNNNNFNSLMEKLSFYQNIFKYSVDKENVPKLNVSATQESADPLYKHMIELYGGPILSMIDYLSLNSDLTFSANMNGSNDLTNDIMSYQMNGIMLPNNTINIYMFKNTMEECQNPFLKDIKENEIVFKYEMREYKGVTKEERFRYFATEKYDDSILLYEFTSNYTIPGKNNSVIDTKTISQEEARRTFCNLLSESKK